VICRAQDLNFKGKRAGDINGTCVCARTLYSLLPGAEALSLELDHTYLLPTQVRRSPPSPLGCKALYGDRSRSFRLPNDARSVIIAHRRYFAAAS
jgi:hypothetical protein